MGRKARDLTGVRFGKLVAKKLADKSGRADNWTWECRCDCGRDVRRKARALSNIVRRNSTWGCGGCDPMVRSPMGKNESGKRYGRLVVEGRAPQGVGKKRGSAHAMWTCLCDCGERINTTATSLRKGHVTRCKVCGLENKRKPRTTLLKSALNSLYLNYRWHAKDRGIDFKLDRSLFDSMAQCDCHYCGRKPEPRPLVKRLGVMVLVNLSGIDRKDSDGMYEPSNCVPACKKCGEAKMDTPYEEYLDWIDSVAIHRGFIKPESVTQCQ